MGYVQKDENKEKAGGVNNAYHAVCVSSVMTVMTAAQGASLVSATLTTDKEVMTRGKTLILLLR